MARILYLEDESHKAEEVFDKLREQGHTVDIIPDGGRAMLAVDRGASYDYVLLHLELPGIDGAEFCRWLRDSRNLTHTPKVAYSWNGEASRFDFSNGLPSWLPVDSYLGAVRDPGALLDQLELAG